MLAIYRTFYRFLVYRFVVYRFVGYRFVGYRFVIYRFVIYRFIDDPLTRRGSHGISVLDPGRLQILGKELRALVNLNLQIVPPSHCRERGERSDGPSCDLSTISFCFLRGEFPK